jgi:hypothetical protein
VKLSGNGCELSNATQTSNHLRILGTESSSITSQSFADNWPNYFKEPALGSRPQLALGLTLLALLPLPPQALASTSNIAIFSLLR